MTNEKKLEIGNTIKSARKEKFNEDVQTFVKTAEETGIYDILEMVKVGIGVKFERDGKQYGKAWAITDESLLDIMIERACNDKVSDELRDGVCIKSDYIRKGDK